MRAVRTLVIKLLPRDKLIRSSLVLAGGTAAGQAVSIVASPLLARLYSPADFGVLSVFNSFLALFAMAATLRLEMAILIAKDRRELASLIALAMVTTTGMTIIIPGALFLLRNGANGTGLSSISRFWGLLALGIFFAALLEILGCLALRRGDFKLMVSARIRQVVIQVLAQFCFAAVGIGPMGLLAGEAVGRAIAAATLFRKLARFDAGVIEHLGWRELRNQAIRYRKFPLLTMPSALVDNLANQVPVLMTATFFGSSVTGQFFMAWRLIGVPVSLIACSTKDAFTSELSGLLLRDPSKARHLFITTYKRLVRLVAVPMIALFAFGPTIIRIALGSQWSACGKFLRILSIPFMINNINGPFLNVLTLLERQELKLALSVVSTGLVAFSTWFFAARTGDAFLSIWAMTIAQAACSLGHSLVVWRSLERAHLRSESRV